MTYEQFSQKVEAAEILRAALAHRGNRLPTSEWRFELCYLGSSEPTHVLASMWEEPEGCREWRRYRLSAPGEGEGLLGVLES